MKKNIVVKRQHRQVVFLHIVQRHVLWDDKWPIKPDIVFEGGNVIRDSYGCTQCTELSLLTLHHRPFERQFSTIWATSAAAAQAAWMAAQIQAHYPQAWPETIRALMIHSANWTEQMKCQFLTERIKAIIGNCCGLVDMGCQI